MPSLPIGPFLLRRLQGINRDQGGSQDAPTQPEELQRKQSEDAAKQEVDVEKDRKFEEISGQTRNNQGK